MRLCELYLMLTTRYLQISSVIFSFEREFLFYVWNIKRTIYIIAKSLARCILSLICINTDLVSMNKWWQCMKKIFLFTSIYKVLWAKWGEKERILLPQIVWILKWLWKQINRLCIDQYRLKPYNLFCLHGKNVWKFPVGVRCAFAMCINNVSRFNNSNDYYIL